jgi:predicted nucleotidyltransferase
MTSHASSRLEKLYLEYSMAYTALLHQSYGSRLQGVLLYGSLARREAHQDSDIDILTVVQTWHKVHLFDRLRELHQIHERLRTTSVYGRIRAQGYPPTISDYPLSPDEMDQHHPIYLDMLSHHRILYEQDGFLRARLARIRKTLRRLQARRISLPSGGYYWRFEAIRPGDVVSYEQP